MTLSYPRPAQRLRIAVFLEHSPDTGGGFHQSFSTIESLVREIGDAHTIVVFTPFERSRAQLAAHGIEAVVFKKGVQSLLDIWSGTLVGNAAVRRLRSFGFRRLGRHLDAVLDDHAIDLAIFNTCVLAQRIGDHPFIVTVWDLDHRDYPDLPEMFVDRVFERRERVLRSILTRAIAVIANAPSGARRLASLYHVDPHRIIELPFLPSVSVRRQAAGKGVATAEGVRKKYQLPAQYVFYPAYFSFHKNHLYLLEGLIELERRHGIALDAVFCGGGAPGDQESVERQVEALGLKSRVRFLGLVPDGDLPALYEGAMAMVMPSYCGPTNLPPLEAVTLGCPALCSDLPGCREQMGDAALYCDLSEPSSLADHLASLVNDPAVVDRLRVSGAALAAELATINYGERLTPVLNAFAYLRRRWAWPERPPRTN